MKCVLFIGQSLPNEFCTWGSSTLTPHADTHMWNGSGWSAPVGDGAITYANCLREALQTPIYLVNACVGNTPLTNYGSSSSTDYWACAAGSLFSNAVSQVQAALASVSGLCLDRIEWWHGQYEVYTGGWYDLYGAYKSALQALIANFRAALGNGFRFCIWPVGKVHTGSTAPVIHAQMDIANATGAAQAGIEPGSSSYDRNYRDSVHFLTPSENVVMGIRAARNALSYFIAKANAADSIPHYGAGPIITSLTRHPNNATYTMFVNIAVKNGHCIVPTSQWPNSDTTWLNAFSANAPLTGSQLMGGKVKLYSSVALSGPITVSYQGERDCSSANVVYDTNQQWGDQGQPMLPLALGALTSN